MSSVQSSTRNPTAWITRALSFHNQTGALLADMARGDEPAAGLAELPEPSAFVAFLPFLKGVFSRWHYTPFKLAGESFVTNGQ